MPAVGSCGQLLPLRTDLRTALSASACSLCEGPGTCLSNWHARPTQCCHSSLPMRSPALHPSLSSQLIGSTAVGVVRAFQRDLRRRSAGRRSTMKTVGGVTHRLRWADRNAPGFRMRCECGWVDRRIHANQMGAEMAGRKHVQRS